MISNCINIRFLFTWTLALISMIVHSQNLDNTETDTSSSDPIVVINADNTKGIKKGRESYLTGNVILRQDSVFIYADRVNLYADSNSAHAFGDVSIQRDDTTSAFCQTLIYAGNKGVATMTEEVILQSGAQKLFSEKLEYDVNNNICYYSDKAVMTDGVQIISSKSGRYYIDSSLVVFYDSVVVAGEDFYLKTDSLHFNTSTNVASFVAPVRMRQKDNAIYCEDGYYDLENNYAVLIDNAQYQSPTQRAEADTIFFDGNSEDVILSGNAHFIENDRDIKADRIDYLKSENKAILIGNVQYSDSTQTAQGKKMTYDLESGAFETEGRAAMRQPNQYLAADQMREVEENLVKATGKVIWHDSIEQVSLFCQEALINEKTKSVYAYGDSLLLVSQLDGDSLFLTADTLFTERTFDTDSNEIRNVLAYRNVIGYKKDLQFVADSAVFSGQDSMMRIFGDPVIWSDTSRFYSDTIHILMADDAIDELILIENAFIVNKAADELYNQIKGRKIIAEFRESQLSRARVRGNAESIYYAADESGAFIGVNEVICANMDMIIEENVIGEIKFYGRPTSELHPLNLVSPGQMRLSGFTIDDELRPLNRFDIFRIYNQLKNLQANVE